MKKILFLLLAFCNFIAYAVDKVNMDEVNKYIREKLDRDKEITLTSKINEVNNALEVYSEEGKLCAVNSLKEYPDMSKMNRMKNKISEKNGKLNPISEIYLPNGQLAVRNTYKLNKVINLFETEILIAYIDGDIPYNDQLKSLADAIDSIKIKSYENGEMSNSILTTYEINHKTQQITIKNGLSEKVTITKKVLSLKGLNGTMETYYENGKINKKIDIKNGLFNGKIESFSDKSGKLIGTGTMKDSLPDGEFIEYDEAGKVISKIKYKDGKEVK